MLKIELHAHTSEDPVDDVPYSTCQLIDRAAQLGYHALAITLHDRQLDLRPFASFAADRGITLIPGIERTIEGRHVLLLNFSPATESVNTFDDLARLKSREDGLVVAPHPFFPIGVALGDMMDTYARLFDAVEYNAMFTAALNFNRRALRWARWHGKPLVGCGDVHRLRQLGSTYSLVDSEPTVEAICAAIKKGRVEVRKTPLSILSAATLAGQLLASGIRKGGLRQLAAGHS